MLGHHGVQLCSLSGRRSEQETRLELATLTSANRLVKKREPEFRSRNGLSGTRIYAKFRYGWEKDLAQGHSFTAVDATSCDDLGGWHPRGLDVQSLRLTVRLAPWRRTLT
jgi:hypothetical protein